MRWPWQKGGAEVSAPENSDTTGWYAEVTPSARYVNYYEVQVYSPTKTKWGPAGGTKSMFANNDAELAKQVKEHILVCKKQHDFLNREKIRIDL